MSSDPIFTAGRVPRTFCATLLLAVACLLLLPAQALAQSTPSADTDLRQRLEALERRITEIESRVDSALAHTQAAAPANPSGDRLERLDHKVQLLEASSQTAQTQAKTAPIVAAGKDGFSISSPDKTFRLKIGGYAQADGKTFYDDRSRLLTNSFGVRRARLNVDAKLGNNIDIRIAPEFGNGSVVLFDAYGDLKMNRFATIRGGKFKTPLGLEMLQNDTELTFIERALPSDLVPNRDEGFQLFSDLGGRVTYQVAVLNGANDGTSIDTDTNDGKDIVARVFATPFAGRDLPYLQGLGFGIGTSSGRQNGASLPSLKSVGGQASFFSFVSGATAAGRRYRFTPQLSYYAGPFGLLGEYVESSQTISGLVSNATVTREITNHAWQVAGSWVITGEKKSYKGVVPKRGIETSAHGAIPGAWEIAARYSELNVDPTAFSSKLADATKSAEAARTWTLGLNWYLSRNARLSFNYDQTHFEGGAKTGNRPSEKAFSQRLQIVL